MVWSCQLSQLGGSSLYLIHAVHIWLISHTSFVTIDNFLQAHKLFNPVVRCLGKVGYAVARTKKLNLVLETASSLTGHGVLEAVEEGGLGETNVNQQFSWDVAGKNNKQWGFTFEDFDRIFFSYPTNIHVEGPSISKLLRGIWVA